MTRNRIFMWLNAAAIGLAVLAATPAAALDKIKVGMLRNPNASFTASEKGFYEKEGIEVEYVFFRSGAELVPALSIGQIDVAMASSGASIFNAMAQGVSVKIVGGLAVFEPDAPGGDPVSIAIRQDLIDSGQVKTGADLKGLTMAVTARGQFTHLFVAEFLKDSGLTLDDVKLVNMPYPDMLAAFQGKAIDAASFMDPHTVIAEDEHLAVRFKRLSEFMPGLTLAVVVYGERLGETDRELGMRFMRALHEGNVYNREQLGKEGGRAEIAQIYQKHAPLQDVSLYENPKVGLSTGHDTLVVDVDGEYGLRWQLERYTEMGLVPVQPTLEAAIDNSFAEAAAKNAPAAEAK